MKLDRKSVLGRSAALAVFAACFFSAPAHSPAAPPSGSPFTFSSAPGSPAPARIGVCEATLAACMNGGGDSDRCWNAYWRCISR